MCICAAPPPRGLFQPGRHVRTRTPRSKKRAGPVLLGPVSHRARLCVELSAEGHGSQRTHGFAQSGLTLASVEWERR